MDGGGGEIARGGGEMAPERGGIGGGIACAGCAAVGACGEVLFVAGADASVAVTATGCRRGGGGGGGGGTRIVGTAFSDCYTHIHTEIGG
jgi:hypothetical protein